MSNNTKRFNKFVATATGAAVVATMAAPAANAAWTNTPDWLTDSLQDLVNYGVIDADSTVSATGEVTRGEVALYFARALKLDMENVEYPNFADVPTTHKYYNAIAALANAGKMNGTEKGFEPDRVINRAEMASLIVKAFGYEYGNGNNLPFTDLKGAEWAKNAIAGLTDAGIKLGVSETKFAPLSKLTRQDTAAFLWKVMKDQGIDFSKVGALTINEVHAVNPTSIKLVGTALDQLKADQLQIEGNKVVSVTANENKNEAIVVFEKPFVSGQEQLIKFIEKVEGESDKVTEFKFTFTLDIETIEATTVRVDDHTDKQYLGFTINDGQSINVNYLKDSGYTVEFQATKNVFEDASTGELKEEALKINEKFSYKVVIKKDKVVVESQLTEVEVLDFSTFLTSINEVTVSQGDVVVDSSKVTVEDGAVKVQAVKATALNGVTINNPTVTYTSSNPAVATVNALTGEVTPIKPGTVTITITADDAKKEIPLTVVTGAREASKVVATTNNVKLLASKAQTVDLQVVDQYGDEFEGTLSVVSKDNDIATGNGDSAIVDGKATATITAIAKGNTTIEVKAGDKVLSTIPVAVSDDSTVASRKIETVQASADYKLDIVQGSNDKALQLVWNQYNAGGFLIGPETDFAKYTVESSDNTIVKVAADVNGVITVSALKEGTANVVIKEGTVTRETVKITVVDTTPTITEINFEKVEDLTTEGAFTQPVLKPEGIKLSSSDYNAEITKDGTIFVDVDNNDVYEQANDITLGQISALYSGVANDIANLGVNAGSIQGTLASGAKGTIVVKVTRNKEAAAFATSTIKVNVK